MNSGNYKTAIEYLDKIQAPLSVRPLCPASSDRHDLLSIQRTTSRTPPSPPPTASSRPTRDIPCVDYAYYMKGLANFNRSNSLLERLAPTDRSRTDTNTARQAYSDFAELTRKFPDSKYAEDARQRMLFCTTAWRLTKSTWPIWHAARRLCCRPQPRHLYIENLFTHSSRRGCAQHHDPGLHQDGHAATRQRQFCGCWSATTRNRQNYRS